MSTSRKKTLLTINFFIKLAEDTPEDIKKNGIIQCLDDGANINERFSNDCNNTPLHISVIIGNVEVVKLLLERGAKINYRNTQGKTPLDIAKELDTEVGQAIVEILEAFEADSKTNVSDKQNTVIDTIQNQDPRLIYQKRGGTSGILGPLYESKLLSLVFIRASLNKQFDQFYLGTGSVDSKTLGDLCLRYIEDDTEGVLFLKANCWSDAKKTKITLQDLWRTDGEYSLHKHFDSFMAINKNFETATAGDPLYKTKTHYVKCSIVVYTTAEMDLKDKMLIDEDSTDKTVKDLISTDDSINNIYRYKYNDEDIALLTNTALIKRMACIGKTLARSIRTGNYENLVTECCIEKFHVVLALNVINVSETKEGGFRIGNFRKEFLYTFDVNLVKLKMTLYQELISNIQLDRVTLCQLIDNVCIEPTKVTIAKLMNNILTYYSNFDSVLIITEERFKDVTYKLLNVKVSFDMYNQALELSINETIGLIYFNLPKNFGNIDIVVEDQANYEIILVHLAEYLIQIINLTYNSNSTNKYINLEMSLTKVLASSVGNLLLFDEKVNGFKFNMNERSLGKNAKTVLDILKSRIDHLSHVIIRITHPNFPKYTIDSDDYEKQRAIIFLNTLRFYTCQSKEDEIDEHAKEVIKEYCIKHKPEISQTSNVRYDAIYFIIHDAVLKWWMTDEKSYYLENNKEFIDRILNNFSENSLLNVISCMYINKMTQYGIAFNNDAIDCLASQVRPEVTILITEVNVLTGIKLVQCFNDMNNYAFIDLNDNGVTCFSRKDYHTLTQDLKNIELKALIILYEDTTVSKNNIFRRLINKSITKNFILVTNEKSAQKLKHYIERETVTILKDVRNDMNHLDFTSQERILENIFLFQGAFSKFSNIMTPQSKNLITANILQKIVIKEIIDIGKTLITPTYNEIKNYYVQRNLSRIRLPKNESQNNLTASANTHDKEIFKIHTLDSLKDTVVIVGVPGIGKSTYLTYLSIITKIRNPSIWIERINLLDQTKQLYRLKEKEIRISKIEAMKFVCNAALSRNLIRFSINPTPIPNFDLEIKNGEIVLKDSDEIDCLVKFELEMFLHCYNQGDTILLFDGFDEICPHYKQEMTEILKWLVMRWSSDAATNVNQRMWITSRSYNNIRETLEKEFGVAYNLTMFTQDEQDLFMTKYFKMNVNISDLNIDQFKNIDSFFEFMENIVSFYPTRGGLKFYKDSTMFLKILYFNAMTYFINEVSKPLTSDKKAFNKKWASIFDRRQQYNKYSKVFSNLQMLKQSQGNIYKAASMIFTPLHIYIVLDYFINQIKTVNTQEDDFTNKWDLETNMSLFYKYFIEKKLIHIRFEDKNQVDLHNPDNKRIVERELKDFIIKHKKLAIYASFKDNLNEILTISDIKEIQNLIKGMEAGREKTGIVDSILSDGIPKFVHLSFQEYLAVEYISDLLKTHKDDQSKLWRFILNRTNDGFLDFFDRKLESDENLINIITNVETKQMIFNDLTGNQNIHRCPYNSIVLKRSVHLGLKQTTKILLKAIADVIDINNLSEFINSVNRLGIFNYIAQLGWDENMKIILNLTRSIDYSRLSEFNPGFLKESLYIHMSDEDIIRHFKWEFKKLNESYKKKMKIKPRSRYCSV